MGTEPTSLPPLPDPGPFLGQPLLPDFSHTPPPPVTRPQPAMPPSNTPAGSPQTPPTLPVASWAPVAPEEPVTQPLSGESCSLGSVHVEGRGRRALGPVRCQTLSLSPFLTSPLPHPPSLSSSFLRCLLPSPVGSCMGCSMGLEDATQFPIALRISPLAATTLDPAGEVYKAGRVSPAPSALDSRAPR